MFENIDLGAIMEEKTRELVKGLLNFIEQLSSSLREARAENQRLRDENNRLKGEQGKPEIKANVVEAPKNHSSEKERKKPRKRQEKKKTARIVIDREEVLKVDQALLPADAIFKGYEENIVQDILLKTDNVRFQDNSYSPSLGCTYLAELPTGYGGQFGPGIKALSIAFYHGGLMSEPKIIEFFENVGIQISKGTLSNLLIKGHADFHAEKEAVYEAGLASSDYQHFDDTPTRFNGKNNYCHVICNLLYTAYFTRAGTPALAGGAREKLEPVVALHQTLLKDFLTRFWAYYDQLLEYRQRPTAAEASRLEAEFDALFGAPSGYAQLDKRIASTRSNKISLLLVLKFPELPLHNNPAELGARGRVRKRDVSFVPRTEEGKQAWDTFMTLAAAIPVMRIMFGFCWLGLPNPSPPRRIWQSCEAITGIAALAATTLRMQCR
jgi:hypothetical protein